VPSTSCARRSTSRSRRIGSAAPARATDGSAMMRIALARVRRCERGVLSARRRRRRRSNPISRR
jgi:hypothetical protein